MCTRRTSSCFNFEYQMLYTAKVACVFSFAATVISVFALLGGIDAPLVRNIPWLYSKINIDTKTIGSVRVDLWQACVTTGIVDDCKPLTDFGSLFGILNNERRSTYETHAASLPYVQITASGLSLISFISAFGPASIALGLTALATSVQLGSFISATVFFSKYSSPFSNKVKLPLYGGYFLCFTSCVLIMFSLGWLIAAHVQAKRKRKYYDY